MHYLFLCIDGNIMYVTFVSRLSSGPVSDSVKVFINLIILSVEISPG